MQQNQSGFDLRHFVNVNFTLPKEGEKYVPPEGQSLREHIDGLWPVLTRSTENTEKWDSLLPLPEPYVVPGGRFREVYYWDSYFTMLGLAESGHWDKVADMVANFAHEIDTYGHIPNGNRSYYLSRSQPPFFALMVELLAQHEGDAALKQYLPQMQKEYAYWMDGVENLQAGQQEKRVVKLQDGTLLNRYWDDRDTPRPESWVEDIATAKSNPNRPATEIYRDLRSAAASGWDFSSRWMDNPQQLNTLRTTSIVPVDLNSLMFKMEKILARASKAAGDNAMANQYETLANARQKGIEKYLWNDQQGWYADYDLKSHKVRNQLTAAALFPLYVNAAAKDRAAEQANLASRFVGEAQAFAASPAANLRFYAARGPRGLETGLKGSLHTEAAELLGLHNVAQIADRQGLTQVSMENLLRWQPDIILVQEAVTADFIRRDPLWHGVKAVAEQRILFLSGLPFGWLDAPPGINRLLGLRRLHAWLDPAINRQFKSDMQHYAQLFWHCSLSDADYQKLVAT